MEKIELIGYASGIGAGNTGCSQGPEKMKTSVYLEKLQVKVHWHALLTPNETQSGIDALKSIATISKELGDITAQLVAQRKPFITIGGDHSCAIGTWSGDATAISPLDLGLIWIDAHLDSHTIETTPSGNIHGMPLAVLLGHGDKSLTQLLSPQPKLKPENVCVVGVRSFESEEQQLLQDLNVRIFYMEEIIEKGLATVLQEAHTIISKNTQFFGVSLDLDAIQPEEAPGVGTPEPNGLDAQSLLKGLTALMADPRLLGMEIVEFNPDLDKDEKTEKLIVSLIENYWKARNKEGSNHENTQP